LLVQTCHLKRRVQRTYPMVAIWLVAKSRLGGWGGA
jgi:hypothetical protein